MARSNGEVQTSAGSTAEYTRAHWMVKVAVRAGVLDGADFALDPHAPIPALWEQLSATVDLPVAEIASLVADYFRLDVADLDRCDPKALLEVSEALARQFCVFPVAQSDRQLEVATADPTDIEAERALGFTSGKTIVFRIAPPGVILDTIERQYSADQSLDEILVEEMGDSALKPARDQPAQITVEDIHATPVVKLTNLILRDGIRQGASDIHIEPGPEGGKVRYRIDGVLRKHMDLPMSALNRVVSRIKIRSDMDIADRLRPQDGRTRVNVNQRIFDLRVSTIPAGRAEKCVIRVLDQNEGQTLDGLGIPGPEMDRFRRLLAHRAGIVVVTGPTGSGKTTTLYAALREIADGQVNIMTVEDPIEYSLPAVTQTQVEVKQGMTFGSALRAILRQDPDVILVGEIRDGETARVAAQAAMTGHLVLATVHANDAVGAVPRLADLGLEYGIIADTVRGAVAQRLLRRVCPDCAESVQGDLTADELALSQRFEVRPAVRAVGCSECGFTGYRGRIPILEVLTVDASLESAIVHKKGSATLQTLAVRGGMRDLRSVALEWVASGDTTLVEVERVVGVARAHEEEGEGEAKGPPRILVVDDEEDSRLRHRAVLEEDGYDVVEAAGGPEAVAILKEDPHFSLMLLDLKMPEMDGLEVLRSVRDTVHTYAMPVMISTADDSEVTEARLLDAGADDFLGKDAAPSRLQARVRAVLRRSKL